jgi:type II secretory pathway component GspD/PulD (secretin)
VSLFFRRSCLLTLVVALTVTLGTLPFPATAAAPTKLITLDAEDAYLPSVLKVLAEKGDLNIVTGPGVTAGKLSIHLKDVPIDQAVNLVVRAAGLAYERIGNSILVADAKSLKDETGLSAYIVDLKFADAAETKLALKTLCDAIEVDKSGNRLIVSTSPRIMSEITEIVATLDQPARQVMLEARIVEVSTDDVKELGIDWNLLNRQGFIIIEGTADSTNYEEVGVKLRITPLINSDGYITTEISPEVSSVTGFTGTNNDLPIVATRQAKTTVRLKDGNSVIIGGLLSEERTNQTTKIPLLGDIPILGYLFRHQSIRVTKKDLVIEITPRILPEQQ